MRIIVLGVPHSPTRDPTTPTSNSIFPFSEQVWWLCHMFKKLGHEVTHLGVPGSNPPCKEHIDLVPKDLWQETFGDQSVLSLLYVQPNQNAKYTELYIKNLKETIQKVAGPDFSTIITANWGGDQKVACQGLNQFVVEPGIGYRDVWAPYRVYNSYTWMHYILGNTYQVGGGQWYNWVIPMPVNLDQFGSITLQKKNYFLYLGRMTEDKGPRIACQVARETNTPIILAGRGDASSFMHEHPGGTTFINNSTVEKKRELLKYAKAAFVPTIYLEPFGAIVLEAGASGCPVITTDWGAFESTVKHGFNGYRCRCFDHFVWAAKNIDKISPFNCYEWVRKNYNLNRIAQMYDEYFWALTQIKTGKGWYTIKSNRTELDWLNS